MITGTEAEYLSDAGSKKDTPYLALSGELWGDFSEYLWENWPRYNGTALYMYNRPPLLTCEDELWSGFL